MWEVAQFAKYIKGHSQFPEGWNVAAYLQHLLYRFGILPPEDAYRCTVLDMFCGKGRLCQAVPLRHVRCYRGVDINPAAISEAQEMYPDYRFDLLDATQQSWKADCVLLWTAISMLDDDEAPAFLAKLDARHIIIGEICGREWRFAPGSATHPPIYNRDWYEFPEMLRAAGYALQHHESQPHARYSDGSWPRERDRDMHTFVFRRDNGSEWGFYKEANNAVFPAGG